MERNTIVAKELLGIARALLASGELSTGPITVRQRKKIERYQIRQAVNEAVASYFSSGTNVVTTGKTFTNDGKKNAMNWKRTSGPEKARTSLFRYKSV